MDINHLKVEELKVLIDAANQRIEAINKEKEDEKKRKDSVKNKTKLSQLTYSDRIFKIEIYRHVDTHEMVVKTGFVNIGGVRKENSEYGGFSYSFGGSSSWFSDEDSENHYLLVNGFGNDSFEFYTLKPNTWWEDYELARDIKIQNKIERFHKELNAYKNSLSKFGELKERINEEISKI
jgi:hypothetical protein